MKLLFIAGTRPEAIKLIPVLFEARQRQIECVFCVTGQHKELMDQVLDFFGVEPEISLKVMRAGQSLSSLSSACLNQLEDVFQQIKPTAAVVQGDTSSAFFGALSAFYFKIPVVHIEAGLRSNNIYSPFPEEVNRRLVSQIASWHFAPTKEAVANLNNEGIIEGVFLSGNTVVDSLQIAKQKIGDPSRNKVYLNLFALDLTHINILVTLHRRENFGENIESILTAISELVELDSNIVIWMTVHPNPETKAGIERKFGGVPNIKLLKPLPYDEFLWLMSKSRLIITDSGGVQEEAPSFGVPVVIVRDTTERMESVRLGLSFLVGHEKETIKKIVGSLVGKRKTELAGDYMNPYGEVGCSARIVEKLVELSN